jgi:hypothetical protein
MKPSKLFIPLALLPLLVLFVGCGDPDPSDPCTNPSPFDSIPDYLRDRFMFQQGSWWVYQEQLSGALDTVTLDTVINSTDYTGGTACCPCYHYYEGYTLVTSHTNFRGSGPSTKSMVMHTHLAGMNIWELFYIVGYDHPEGDTVGATPGLQCWQMIETRSGADTLGGVDFHDLLVVRNNQIDCGSPPSDFTFELAPWPGIIRFRDAISGEDWQLVQWAVTRY